MGLEVKLYGNNLEPPMSALGQKRTLEHIQSMSVLCHKRTSVASFDPIVGDREYARRDSETERLSRGEVDDELEFARPQHRQIGRLLALENPADEYSILAKRIRPSGTVAYQPTGRDRLAPLINCGNRIATCQSDDLI